MNKVLGLAMAIMSIIGFISVSCRATPTDTPNPLPATPVPHKSLVEKFIQKDATFAYDGVAGSVTFMNVIGSTDRGTVSPLDDWEYTVRYETRHPGEGDRTGQALAEAMTYHTAVVKVSKGQIIAAVCDQTWDMLMDRPTWAAVSQAEAQKVAENFIKNSSTFKFDGIEGSIRYISSEPGWTSSFRSTAFTFEYQTRQPGHGDRTGKILAQVITNHTAVILFNIEKGVVALAICDKTWDMVDDKNPPMSVTGTVISDGDTTPPGGPQDGPRVFVYVVQRDDGTKVNVSYTAYPPYPVGDANRGKITLEFAGGSVNNGDIMEALGRIDKETNTIVVADQGDYIRTHLQQAPTPTSPVSENVSWQMGDTVVAATITRPYDKAIHPAIVFVAGSGPTDRDWNSPLLPGTNGSARLLAEELAKVGFVTIRYDKRVAGPNAQKNLPLLVGKISMESHVDELAGAVDQLLGRPDVNRQKIFVLANSEGTIHALNYQITRQPKIAGLILEGMPGRNLADLTRAQLGAQVAPLPNAKDIMAGYDRLMADFLAGKPFVADPTLPEGINNLVQGFYAPINLPFTREFFVLDPAPLIGKVSAPTLVMIGKKDVQVNFQLDGAPLESAAKGHDNVSFVYPDNANHVLKNEPRPRSALTGADALTYNASDRVLDPEALNIIKDWLAKQIG